jgi:LacI family transcriptional regulator
MKKMQGGRDLLRQEILKGHYKPGTYLPSVRTLGLRLKLSKSAVHTILGMLQEEGMLQLSPGRGALVTEFSSDKPILRHLYMRPSDFGTFGYLPVATQTMCGVCRAAEMKNIEVTMSFSDSAGLTESMINAYSRGEIQGVIYLQCQNYNELIKPLGKAGIPCVVAHDMHGFKAVKGGIDFRRITRSAIDYLMPRGHRRIGLLTGAADDYIYSESIAAYRQALADYGLESHPEWLMTEVLKTPSEQLVKLLGGKKSPTAFFTVRDYRAQALYAAAAFKGLRIPNDISVISFDDCTWPEAASLGLTTFHEPLRELGENAVDMLQKWVTSGKPPANRLLEAPLIERGSVNNPG